MWTLRKEMIVALAGVCLSYGTTTQAASIDIAAKPVSVQTSEQSLLTGKETASKQAAWEAFWQGLLNSRVVPDDYTKTVKTSGAIERTYLSDGPHKTARQSLQTQKPMEQYEIYYPVDLLEKKVACPAVIFLNGSGVPASRYPALFEHLASWGFIAIGNEDPSTGTGQSADTTVAKLLELNEDAHSRFFHQIDTARIGITGHSQGGAGVFNAITSQPHHALYRTAVALSPANERLSEALHWTYDLTKVQFPIFLLSGTKGDFELKLVLPQKDLQSMYAKISGPKVMARRKDTEHGQMLYEADGYVTAWLRWQLYGDKRAAKAFSGKNPEIRTNCLYRDVKIQGRTSHLRINTPSHSSK